VVRFFLNFKKYTVPFNKVKLKKQSIFVVNRVHPIFNPSFLFLECLHYCYKYFHCSYMYRYYNYSRTLCMSYPNLIKISLFYEYHWFDVERGVRGWVEAQRQGKNKVILDSFKMKAIDKIISWTFCVHWG
jgi:hypothetical protein